MYRKTFGYLTWWGFATRQPEGDAGAAANPVVPPVVAPAAGAAPAPAAGAVPAAGAAPEPAARVWYDDIPEAPVKELMSLKAYKSPTELATAYFGLNKLVSGAHGGVDGLVPLPAPDAGPEALDAFYAKLGRPESPDKYTIKQPDGFTPDAGLMDFATKAFHKAGLRPDQAQIVNDMWNEYATTQTGAVTQEATEANAAEVEGVKAKWGADLDKNLAAANRVVQSLGLEQDLLNKVEGAIGGAALLEMLSRIGSKSGESGFVAGNAGGGNSVVANMSAEAAAAEVSRLNSDPTFQAKYHDARHPEHGEAVTRMADLFAKAGGALKL